MFKATFIFTTDAAHRDVGERVLRDAVAAALQVDEHLLVSEGGAGALLQGAVVGGGGAVVAPGQGVAVQHHPLQQSGHRH